MLTLQAKEKEIENLTPDKEFVRGTVGAICQVNFEEFWQDYEKWVVFKRDGCEPIKVMVDSLTNKVEIPYTIVAESGEFQVGVFGITETKTLPTLYSDYIKIRYGTDTNATTPPKYTLSEIDQLRLSKQDKLTAGVGVTISENNVISANGGTIKFQTVVELPETGEENVIYLLPNADSQEQNLYDEYIYTNGTWEKIGSASVDVDLTDYVKKTDYATTTQGGVIKLNNLYFTLAANGDLLPQTANKAAVENRTYYRVLACDQVDNIIKVGLTTNTETLTDEEKASAQSWLGITDLVGDIETLLGGI